MKKDRALSIILLLFCLIMYMETFNFAEKTKMQVAGPAVYPRIVIGIIAFLALIVLIQSFFAKTKNSEAFNWKNFKEKYSKVIILFILFGIYVYLLSVLGFILSTLLYMFISQALLMGFKQRKPIIINVCVTSVATFLVYFVFTDFLGIWLP